MNNDLSEDELMFELANLLPCRTGLKYQVWYCAYSHGKQPRIKVDMPNGKSVFIQIENHEVKGEVDKITSQ